MTAVKNRKILSAILGFFRLMYGLLWVVGVFTVLVGIFMPWIEEVRDEFCAVPVNFILQDGAASFMLGGTVHTAQLKRTSGMLQIQSGPLLLAYVYLFVFLFIMAVVLYCLRLAIRIVRKIQEGKIFILENALALRKIALAAVLLFFFLLATQIGFSLFASGRIISDSLVHTGLLGSSLDLSLGDLVLPLFLWALAEAFRAGVSMQEEQDLTV